ncbi:MAG: DUF11 domain-containing protein [Anaerolineae bacterium]
MKIRSITLVILSILLFLTFPLQTTLAGTESGARRDLGFAPPAHRVPASEARSGVAAPLQQAAPVLVAHKIATLHTDADGDGVPSPGDELLYQVIISNTGTVSATGVTFDDNIPDPNTTLVIGTVQVSGGTVITGNGPGHTSMFVDVGTIPASPGSVTISFRAAIANPLPAGVTQVQNRRVVDCDQLEPTSTDDPDTLQCTRPSEQRRNDR